MLADMVLKTCDLNGGFGMIKFNKISTFQKLRLQSQFEVYLRAQTDGKFNMLDFPSVNKYYYNGRMSKDDYLFIIDNYSEIKEWYLKRLARKVK